MPSAMTGIRSLNDTNSRKSLFIDVIYGVPGVAKTMFIRHLLEHPDVILYAR